MYPLFNFSQLHDCTFWKDFLVAHFTLGKDEWNDISKEDQVSIFVFKFIRIEFESLNIIKMCKTISSY